MTAFFVSFVSHCMEVPAWCLKIGHIGFLYHLDIRVTAMYPPFRVGRMLLNKIL